MSRGLGDVYKRQFEKIARQKAVHDEQVRLNEQAAKYFEQQLKKIKAD